MSSEGTLRVTAARRVSSPARRATRETKPETTVVYILVAEVPVTGRAGERAEERAADSSSRRKNSRADGSYISRCRGGMWYIRLRERRRVCVRHIIRQLRSRNNRPEFRVNQFAADMYLLYIWSMGNFRRSQKKRKICARTILSIAPVVVRQLVSSFAFLNLDRCRSNRRRLSVSFM